MSAIETPGNFYSASVKMRITLTDLTATLTTVRQIRCHFNDGAMQLYSIPLLEQPPFPPYRTACMNIATTLVKRQPPHWQPI